MPDDETRSLTCETSGECEHDDVDRFFVGVGNMLKFLAIVTGTLTVVSQVGKHFGWW